MESDLYLNPPLSAGQPMVASFSYFEAAGWHSTCKQIVGQCKRQGMSTLHYSMLLSQAVDDALQAIATEHHEQAIQIAREYDYETAEELNAVVHWLNHKVVSIR